MNSISNIVIGLLSLSLFATTAVAQEDIEPNWESLSANDQVPEWFVDGKIGV